MMKRFLLLILIVFLVSCGRTTQPGNVAALYWIRSIPIEHYQNNTHEGWSIPAGGVEVSHESRRSGSHSCNPHRVPNGKDSNGRTKYRTVYDSCPTYSTWYTYTLWEWTKVRSSSSSGDFSKTPHWNLDITLGDQEREGQRSEEYHAIVVTKSDNCDVSIDQATWSALAIGESVMTDCMSKVSN